MTVEQGFQPTQKDAARQLLLQAGAIAYLTEGDGTTRDWLEPLFDPTDKVTGWTVDGKVPLGFVRMDGGGRKVVVKDRAALLSWANERCPSAIQKMPGQPMKDQVDIAAKVLRESVPVWDRDPDHADQVAEDMLIAALTTFRIHKRSEEAWCQAMLNGEVVKDDGGQEWDEIPGVVIEEAPKKWHVETNKRTIGGVVEELLRGSGILAIQAPPRDRTAS
jgi:hypothetical protein